MERDKRKVKKMLDLDALDLWEKTTGKSIHHVEALSPEGHSMIGFAMMAGEAKTKVLKDNKDTYSGMSLEYFHSLLDELGFQKFLDLPFIGYASEKQYSEALRFYIDRKRGIILVYETYSETRVNNAKILYNIRALRGDEGYHMYRPPIGGSGGLAYLPGGEKNAINREIDPRYIWVGDLDVREGLVTHIMMIDEDPNFEWFQPWVNHPFFWFLNYTQTKGEYDHKAINREVMEHFPQEVLTLIGTNPEDYK